MTDQIRPYDAHTDSLLKQLAEMANPAPAPKKTSYMLIFWYLVLAILTCFAIYATALAIRTYSVAGSDQSTPIDKKSGECINSLCEPVPCPAKFKRHLGTCIK